MVQNGKTLKVFVMGDSPRSLQSVELVNWTGFAFIGRREHLKLLRNFEELSQPGIYLLLSEEAEGGEVTDIYIGETDNFSQRIFYHAQSKDWWDKFVVFVSKDQNLTKAHVKFLEGELYNLILNFVGTLNVMNGTSPGGSPLPMSDKAAMHEFICNIRFILETLGLSYFSSETTSKEVTVNPRKKSSHELDIIEGEQFYIELEKDYRAIMQKNNGMYVLKSGSFIR